MWELWLTITAAVAILVVMFVFVLTKKKQTLPDTPIFALVITLAVLGITFGDDPLIGYSFLGTSMTLSVIYAIRNSRRK